MKVFAGEDTFASYNAAKAYARELADTSARELEVLDGDDLASAAELMRPLDSMSLFDGGKVVLAKRLLQNSRLTKYLDDNFAELSTKPLIIWHDRKLDARLSLSKQLKAKGLVEDAPAMDEPRLASWLVSEAKQSGVAVSRALAQRLVAYKGTDRGILYQELMKLVEFSLAAGRTPDVSDLDSLTGADATGDIWKFLDSLAMGDKRTAIGEFEKLMSFGEASQYLISMLSRELTILAQVVWAKQHGESLQSLKLHPFVLEKATRKASRFTWEKLQKLMQALLRLDMAVKQGRVEEEVGLTVYLLSW